MGVKLLTQRRQKERGVSYQRLTVLDLAFERAHLIEVSEPPSVKMRKLGSNNKALAQEPRMNKWQNSSCTPSPLSRGNTRLFPHCDQLAICPQHHYIRHLI